MIHRTLHLREIHKLTNFDLTLICVVSNTLRKASFFLLLFRFSRCDLGSVSAQEQIQKSIAMSG